MNNDASTLRLNRDRLTILTCMRPLIATKRHHRRAGGGWKSDQYDSLGNYRARVVEVDSFAGLELLLSGMAYAQHDLLIRDQPGEGVNLQSMRRQKATTCPQALGLHTLCVDIEAVTFASFGLDVDPSSRDSLEHAVRVISDTLMPDSMTGCQVIYQWSASAGVKPWTEVRLHLWYWLDRPVFRGSLKQWGKHVEGVDASLYDSVRIHYTADPLFVDEHRRPIPDLIGRDDRGSLRRGSIDGPQAIAPATWLDRPAFEVVELEQRAAFAAERKARREAQDKAMREPGVRSRYKSRARGLLHFICNDLRELPDADRHGYVRGRIRRAFGVRDLIAPEEIADIVRDPAIEGLMGAGRDLATATGEVERLIVELVTHPDRAPAMALSMSERGAPHADKAAVIEIDEAGYLTPEVTRIKVVPPPGKPWAAPAEGWIDNTMTPLSLKDGHAWLDHLMISSEQLADIGGGVRLGVASAAGSGKSYAAKLRKLIDATQGGERAVLVVPTLKLAHEAQRDLVAMQQAHGTMYGWTAVVSASRRGPSGPDDMGTCFYPEAAGAAGRLVPGGSSDFCRACPFHPSDIGDKGESCPFFKAYVAELGAAVVIKTHARAVLEGALDTDVIESFDVEPCTTVAEKAAAGSVGPTCAAIGKARAKRTGKRGERCKSPLRARCTTRRDNGEHEFVAMVIDEDPSAAMTHGGSIDAQGLMRLEASGDLTASAETIGLLVKLMAKSIATSARIPAAELRAAIAPSSIQVGADYLDGAATLASALAADGEVDIERLTSGVPWRTIAGFFEALQENWGACSIHKGRLLVSHTMPIELDRARDVYYLDATATEARTKALLGPDATFRRMRSEWPSDVTVSWLPVDTGVGSRLHVKGARRVPMISAAALDRYAGPTSLVMTSKRNRDPDTWTGQVYEYLESIGCAVEHHRGTAGRGVNLYSERDTIIVDAWHVPQHAIEQQAYAWCTLAEHDWTSLTVREFWMNESRAQMLAAEIIQEIARIRPLSADEWHPKHIIIIDSRDPRSLGLPVDDVIDPDLLVYEQFGWTTGVDTAPSILRDVVETAGGTWSDMVDGRSHMMTQRLHRGTGALVARQKDIQDTLRIHLSIDARPNDIAALVVKHWIGNHGGREQLARRAGVQLSYVETDLPGAAISIFHTRRLHRADVEAWLRPIGATRYRVKGAEQWAAVPGMPSAFHDAVCEVAGGLVPQWKEADAVAKIAEFSGRCIKTVRRAIARLSVPGELLRVTLRRIIREALEIVLVRCPATVEGKSRHDVRDAVQACLDALYSGTAGRLVLIPPDQEHEQQAAA